MKRALLLKVIAKNGGKKGNTTVNSEQIFGKYEELIPEYQEKVKIFLQSVNNSKWLQVPEELMDITSTQNFKYYVMSI